MKLSNKILVTFAAALILIPLLGMIYVSQVEYKVGDYASEWKSEAKARENFSTPIKGMESISISTPFESVNIEDAKKMGVLIHFIESENYGVKVRKELKDSIDFKVDAAGQLQISFLNTRTDNDNYYTSILIYGKSVKQISVVNASTVSLNAKSDTLSLHVKGSGSVNLQNGLNLGALTVTTDDVKDLNVNEVDLKSLTVKLNGTNFSSGPNSYHNLSITSTGKSDIEIGTSYENKGRSIENLFISTLGETNFKLKNIRVEKCTGSFSDQTSVEMPAVNLNQMYKK